MKINVHSAKNETFTMQSIHLQTFFEESQEKNIVIGVRAVNAFSKEFIENGYPTKPFIVKNKTAHTGIAAGLIPINPTYSHISAYNEGSYERYTEALEDVFLQNPNFKPVELFLSEHHFFDLQKKHCVDFIDMEGSSIYYKITWQKDSETICVYAQKEGNQFRILDEQNSPFMVLGKTLLDENDLEVTKPLTSDYDLLVVCPSYREFEPATLDKTPFNTQGLTSKAAERMKKKLLQSTALNYEGPKENPNAGNWSDRIASVVYDINKRINHSDPSRKVAELNMLHHNTEFNNPFACNLAENLPALFFFPKTMNLSALKFENIPLNANLHSVDSILIESLEEINVLRNFLQDMDEGYYWPAHVNYRQEIPAFKPEAIMAAEQSIAFRQKKMNEQNIKSVYSAIKNITKKMVSSINKTAAESFMKYRASLKPLASAKVHPTDAEIAHEEDTFDSPTRPSPLAIQEDNQDQFQFCKKKGGTSSFSTEESLDSPASHYFRSSSPSSSNQIEAEIRYEK